MVALGAKLQKVGEATSTFLNERGDLLILWLVLTVGVAVAAATVEHLKAPMEGLRCPECGLSATKPPS